MQHSASALIQRLLVRGKFRHVQVLLRLAELGSVQRTADAIGTTQSSVTQILAYVEGLLHVRLFERHARGVRPTPACSDLLPVLRQLMAGVADAAEIVTARQKQGQGIVRLVASVAAINGLLLEKLPAFGTRHPAIQVQLRELEGEDQLLAIGRGEVDLVACRRPSIVPEGWEFRPIVDDRLVVVCRADNRLAKLRKPGWRQLAEQTWVLLPVGYAVRTRFDAFAEQFPQAPRTFPVITRSFPVLWKLLLACDLLALVPLTLARPLLDTGELADLSVGMSLQMEPIGILQPTAGMGDAATRLGMHLAS